MLHFILIERSLLKESLITIVSQDCICLMQLQHFNRNLSTTCPYLTHCKTTAGLVLAFRDHGVEKLYRLERAAPPLSSNHRVYLVRPSLVQVKHICDQVNSTGVDTTGTGSTHIVFTPKVREDSQYWSGGCNQAHNAVLTLTLR